MKIDYLKYKILYKHRSSLLKFVLAIFFFGLAFRLLFPQSPDISPILESPAPKKDTILEEPVVLTQDIEEADTADQESHTGEHSLHWLIVDFVCYFPSLFLLWRYLHHLVEKGKK
ncbi:hypothetical protein K1719_017323 [Acacia pycnantha]|nr:hypothetical protein K1719_017323 [Acacia pycnantha]